MLVEQRDPFPESLTKSSKFRYIIAGTLLAGVVLSNAYKSTNVYNIVRPKYIVPYDRVDEILRDNLITYGRIIGLVYFFHHFGDSEDWIERFTKLHLASQRSSPIFLQAETGEYAGVLAYLEAGKYDKTEAFYRMRDQININSAYNETMKVMKSDRSHSKFVQLVVNAFSVLDALSGIGLIVPRKILNEMHENKWISAFQRNVYDGQTKLIFDELKRCSEPSVWLLPDYLAKNYFKLLLNANSYSNVGFESFLPPTLHLFIRGLVPISIIKRIGMATNSVTLNWLQNLVSGRQFRIVQPNVLPSRPNMKGNILVVFVIWGSGICLAVLFYILELRNLIWQKCVKSFYFGSARYFYLYIKCVW